MNLSRNLFKLVWVKNPLSFHYILQLLYLFRNLTLVHCLECFLWKFKTFLEGHLVAVWWIESAMESAFLCVFMVRKDVLKFSHRGELKVGKAIDFKQNDDDLNYLKYHNKTFWWIEKWLIMSKNSDEVLIAFSRNFTIFK